MDSSNATHVSEDASYCSPGSLRAPAAATSGRYARIVCDLLASAAAIVLTVLAGRYMSPATSLESISSTAGWWGIGIVAFCAYRIALQAEGDRAGVRYRVQETAEALQVLAWAWGGVCVGLVHHRAPHALTIACILMVATAALVILARQTLHSLQARDFTPTRKIVQISRRKTRTYVWSTSLKRATDIIMAIALLLFATPLMLCIALAILTDSPGPVFFVQRRVGYRGTMFDIYKFRTMHMHARRYEPSPVSRFDRRITRVGRMLRRTSLDELPQLWNVLRGDMSLVGPRPEMPFIVQQYSDLQSRRLDAIPGITGLWQISAHRGLPIHQNIQYDLDYVHIRSFTVDAAILLHTIVFAMRGI